MSPSKAENLERPTNIRWFVFALACGTSWLLYLHRYTFAFIKPVLAEEWDLGSDQLGLLDSAFSICYMVFQFPLGVAGDAIGVHFVLTTLILLWTGGLAMHAFAPSMQSMWYARASLGVGQSAVFANLNRVARNWFPPSIRTTLQGIAGVTFGRLGGLTASLLFSYLLLGVLQLNWRTAIYVLSAVGIAHAFLFFAIFRNSPRNHRLVNDAEADLIQGQPSHVEGVKNSTKRMTVRQMLSSMKPRALVNLICLNVNSALSTIADNIFSAWIPLFLFQVHDLKFKEMGIYSALPLLGGAIAGFIGGVLNDVCIAVTGNRRWSRSAVACVGKGMAAVLVFSALAIYDNPYAFCWILFFVKFFGDWSLTTSWGVVTDIGGRATASVFAFNNSVATIGAILAPVMYGYLAEYHGWPTVFIVAGVAYVLCAVSWLLIDCTIPVIQDEERNKRSPKKA